MVDCIIVGASVAGVSAALTLQSNGKTFMLFGSKNISKKVETAEVIHNYVGLPDVTGKQFQQAIQTQLALANIAVTEERVTGVYAMKGKFTVTTAENRTYESKTVVLACGVETVKAVDGEERFSGRGVSYCATCDGFLYRGKRVAALCTSKALEGEVSHLAHFAEKVYLFALYKDVAIEQENVEIIRRMPTRLDGGLRVETVVYKDGAEEKMLAVDGVFIIKQSLSPSTLVGGLETENGHVKANKDSSTNLAGLFAAGDVTGRPYQYAKAAGEGNVAAHSVCAYLEKE